MYTDETLPELPHVDGETDGEDDRRIMLSFYAKNKAERTKHTSHLVCSLILNITSATAVENLIGSLSFVT
jgi:hypothetical protein